MSWNVSELWRWRLRKMLMWYELGSVLSMGSFMGGADNGMTERDLTRLFNEMDKLDLEDPRLSRK